jgi:type IV pilus assembly protein PilQ
MLIFLLKLAEGNLSEASPPSTLKESRISLQFSQIEMTELLQLLARMGNTNFLLSESIQGKISVDLKDTPLANCPPFHTG